MTFDDTIRKLHTELRIMQSQFSAYDDRILSPIVRAKRACEHILSDRESGDTLDNYHMDECLSGVRMDLERIALHGVIRQDLHKITVDTGTRFLGWTFPDGAPALPSPLPAYV